MSSNMTQIDEGFIQYPVPGIDNDSQGFRDRYSTIRTNLNIAREELGLLNTNTAKINTNNNFGGNEIINAVLRSTTTLVNESFVGGIDSSQNINFTEGYVHIVRCDADLTLTLNGWPSSNFANIKLILTTDGPGRTITISAGTGIIRDDSSPDWLTSTTSTRTILIESDTIPKIIEAFTYDAGNTVFLRNITQVGGSGSSPTSLNNLSNVNIGTLSANQTLTYDVGTGVFINTSTIKTTSGTTIIDLNSGEIKRADGTAIIDTADGTIKRADGTVVISADGSLLRRTGETVFNGNTGALEIGNTPLAPAELIIPSFSSAERDNGTLTSIREGSIIYNSTLESYQVYVGGLVSGEWKTLPVTGGSGLAAPSFTTTERNLLTPTAGDIIFNSSTNKHQGFDGTNWNDMY